MALMYTREDSRRFSTTPDAKLEDEWSRVFGSANSAVFDKMIEKEQSANSYASGQYIYLKCVSCGDEIEHSFDAKFNICPKCGTGTYRTKYGWR